MQTSVRSAALVTLVDRYSRVALGATPTEVQKLMYFLQVLGEPLNLRYARSLYGPYADTLRHVLDRVEGHLDCAPGARAHFDALTYACELARIAATPRVGIHAHPPSHRTPRASPARSCRSGVRR